MESQRETAALQRQLDAANAALPQQQRPVIPEMPTGYEEDFPAKMKARDKAIQDAAKFDANIVAGQEQESQHQQQLEQQHQQVSQNREAKFNTTATTLGVSSEEVSAAFQTIYSYGGVGVELSEFVMEDEQGPVIVDYLSKHPEEVEKLQGLSPAIGAVHIHTVVKPAAIAGRKVTTAPPPADGLGSGGAPPDEGGGSWG